MTSFQSALSYTTLSLSPVCSSVPVLDSFSLPVVFFVWLVIFFLLTAGSYLLERRPKVRMLLNDSPKSVSFPLLKISPPLFLQFWKLSDETVTALYLQPSQL